MRTTSLEKLLLITYREAIHQNDLIVADIVLSAIEACAPPTAWMTESVIEAYTLAARAMENPAAKLKGSKRGP